MGILSLPLLILLAFAVLSVIVLIHEFGHFIVAKKSGVWVEEFGLGLPPRIWGKKIGETLYSINALPIGGFVRLHGESLEEGLSATNPKRAFVNKSKKIRIAVALAGIVMNFILAVVCFSLVYSITGIDREIGPIKLTDISENSPAKEAGLLPDDRIITINGQTITSTAQVQQIVADNLGKELNFVIERPNEETTQTLTISLTPRVNPPEGQGAVGIAFSASGVETYYPPLWQRPFVGAYYGIKSTFELSKAVLGGFAQISSDVSQGQAPEGIVGPVGIFAVIAEFFKSYGLLAVVNLTGIISLNLAIFNLIPFPPLDGSRVLFVLLESIVGKKRLPKIESISQQVGMILLLVLFVVLTGSEIPKLIKAGSLSGFVEGLMPQ